MRVSFSELDAFAASFVASLPHEPGAEAYVVGLSGELGAGKTAFVQKVAAALAVPVVPTSPTFVLVQRYPIARPPFTALIHMDAYRLPANGADTMGWVEYVKNPANLIMLEWPEHAPGGVPPHARHLSFSVVDETTRDITDTYGEKN